jgi:hypothetical protein
MMAACVIGPNALGLIEGRIIVARHNRCWNELRAAELPAMEAGVPDVLRTDQMLQSPKLFSAGIAEQCLDNIVDVVFSNRQLNGLQRFTRDNHQTFSKVSLILNFAPKAGTPGTA